jgi:hypothetical protein
VDGKIVNWAGIPMQGQPLGGMVPYVYIPHIRAGEFYGISLLERKQELAQEINERMADVGDIVYPTDTQPSTATVQWATDLLSIARTEAYTPPVCYGVDEGSQRSGMTLVLRMLPLVVHVRQERTLMTAGLNQVARLSPQTALLGLTFT